MLTKIECMSLEKQYELCYQDTIKVISEAKQKVYEVTKWIVTLQTLVIGAAFSNKMNFSESLLLLPLFIGLMGAFLNKSISDELNIHRKTLADIRDKIGGVIYEVNKDQVRHFLNGDKPNHKNYFFSYNISNIAIIILSSFISSIIVLFHNIVA